MCIFDRLSCASRLASVVVMVSLVLSDGVEAADDVPTTESIKSAVMKSIPLLEKGAQGSMEQRKQCFTCHNQGLPIMALRAAQSRGLPINEEHLKKQIEFTANFLAKNKANYREGKGQGGQVDTAGYALWTLDNGGWAPDETTAAVAEYLLQWQKDKPHWQPQSRRPPTEQSLFTSSYVALRGLKVFGTADQKERIDARVAQVREWLLKTMAEETEDAVFRLRALQIASASEDSLRQATEDLLKIRRADGGWGQLPDLPSDPYATATALVTLHQAGGLATSDPAYRRGVAYLIAAQKEDGSWHVVTRSKPIQTYFESGYPHGKDQFISIAAAGWSTTALVLALPEAAASNTK